MSETKYCPQCERTLHTSSFGAHRGTKDGLQAYCRECRSKAKRVTQEFTTYTRTRDGKIQTVTRRVDGHGLSKQTPLYKVWSGMRRRCHEPAAQNYKYYGGRGISVCDEWRVDFLSFYRWATSAGYEPGMELDRINNDQGYSPQNCRWVTKLHNLKNRRAYLPDELEERLVAEASRRDMPVYALVREAIEAHLGP